MDHNDVEEDRLKPIILASSCFSGLDIFKLTQMKLFLKMTLSVIIEIMAMNTTEIPSN